MGNIRYQRTAHRITSAVNCRPLKPSPQSICPAAPYPTGVHIPGIPPPAKFATEPKLLRKYAVVPERLVTDDLRSYGAATLELGIDHLHERGRWKNNQAENSHQPTRRRGRQMQRYKSA